MLYEMRLVGLAMDPFSNSPIVILKDRDSVDREAQTDALHADSSSKDQGEDDDEHEGTSSTELVATSTNVDAAAVLADHEVLLQELEDSAPYVQRQEPQEHDNTATAKTRAEHILPIWIGEAEAHSIATILLGLSTPRPMTHDLLFESIKALGGRVHRIIVTDLRDNTFYATIELTQDSGEMMALDARPSDAIALALRCEANIFVDERVLEKTKQSEHTPQFDEDNIEELNKEQWEELVESLSGDSAKKYTQ